MKREQNFYSAYGVNTFRIFHKIQRTLGVRVFFIDSSINFSKNKSSQGKTDKECPQGRYILGCDLSHLWAEGRA